MNIRDYIEKVASSRAQLRLAKKQIDKGGKAFSRIMAHNDPENPMRLSRRHLRRDNATMGRYHDALNVKAKHRYGRQAAEAYAMGDKVSGDMYKRFGQGEKKDLMDSRFARRNLAKEVARMRRRGNRI